jgi:hypothetical protein
MLRAKWKTPCARGESSCFCNDLNEALPSRRQRNGSRTATCPELIRYLSNPPMRPLDGQINPLTLQCDRVVKERKAKEKHDKLKCILRPAFFCRARSTREGLPAAGSPSCVALRSWVTSPRMFAMDSSHGTVEATFP